MELNEITSKAKETMDKSIEFTESQLSKIRTGRASASILDDVSVDAYGTATPISQTATVSVPDARSLIVQPWDKSLLPAIEKAIQVADLGFNPQNDGQVIRINVPPLTQERRKEFVKMAKTNVEDGKVAIRNVRRDANDSLKKAEKNKELSEDFRKQGEEEIQKLTDDYIKNLDSIFDAKEKELMDE
ncbi:ribosome recycling factor [Candidatus Kapabacteria bacterium]|nr:ribosome recycling factor [Candidatus Kapabacteria bacterium]